MNQGLRKLQSRGTLARMAFTCALAFFLFAGMPVHASAGGNAIWDSVKNWAIGRAKSEVEDYVDTQQDRIEEGKTVQNPVQHLKEKYDPKSVVDAYTKDPGTGHSSTDFLYRSAKGTEYGAKVTGGDDFGSGTVVNVLEDENVRRVLHDPRSSNVGGLGGADMIIDSNNNAAYEFMEFHSTKKYDKDYQNMSGKDKFVENVYRFQASFQNSFTGTGQGLKRMFENIFKEQSKVNKETGHTDFLDLFILFSTPNSKKGSEQDTAMSDVTGGLKPNIYLYGDEGTKCNVSFDARPLLTAADPDYPISGWDVVLDGNGRLTVSGAGSRPDRIDAAADISDAARNSGSDAETFGTGVAEEREDSCIYYMEGVHGLGGDIAAEDGTIGYLFYESLADKGLFQYEEAWVIPADGVSVDETSAEGILVEEMAAMAAASPVSGWKNEAYSGREKFLYELMLAYGFNEVEASDFAVFWDGFLRKDVDYLFYPQLTEIIDLQMPLSVTPEPEHRFRMWFTVEEYNGTERFETPAITEKASHDGLSLTEWGIAFRYQEEFKSE